jgi:hypothetical protein
MGILFDGMEPLREAQEELMTRLDAILVELRHAHLLMEAMVESRAESGTPAPV